MMPSSNSQYIQLLKSMECPDATYAPADSPLVMAKAQGSEIWDVEGKRYIDLCSGFGVMALGHNPSYLRKVLSEPQLLMHAMGDVYPSQAKIELLAAIRKHLPSHLTHGAFAVTGGQAVEFALKTAMIATGRSGFIALEGAYHGLDFGSLAVTYRQDFRQPFASWLQQNAVTFVAPECPEQDLHDAYQKLCAAKNPPAAIIVEPVQGRAGIKPLSLAFLERIRKFCDQQGILLIYDEIFCGYGRTGRFSFAEHVPCDITCMGKPMGGGLALSGIFATQKVMQAWPNSPGEALHTGTFFGHALACRLGLEMLQEFETHAILQSVRSKGEYLKEKLAKHPVLRNWTLSGEGLMLALTSPTPGAGAKLMDICRSKGLILLASGPQAEGVTFSPAFNISEALLDESLTIIAMAIAEE